MYSPWSNLQPSDFTQLSCRYIHLAASRFQWQLRDYSKPLVDAFQLTLTGPLAIASRRSMDSRGQRDCEVVMGAPWQPASIAVVRHVAPTKFFYELVAGETVLSSYSFFSNQFISFNIMLFQMISDAKDLSLCYGSNWEPAIAWLNLRLDDLHRPSLDRSQPSLGWWDRVRLNYHGRLGLACNRFAWLYSTSLDPYNAHEFLTFQWTNCTFNWVPG